MPPWDLPGLVLGLSGKLNFTKVPQIRLSRRRQAQSAEMQGATDPAIAPLTGFRPWRSAHAREGPPKDCLGLSNAYPGPVLV